MRINGFEQIKAFYSWVFNEPEKARPTHISLYLFLLNQNNRANWVEWFKCPYDLAMHGARIGNKGTYYNCLNDLKEWKIIDYKKGQNNFKAPLIKLSVLYDNEQLTEQVTVPQSEPQPVPQSEPQPVPQTGKKYKLLTDNIELITDNIEYVIEILMLVKKGKEFYDLQLEKSGNDKTYKMFIDILFGDNILKRELTHVLKMKEQVSWNQFESVMTIKNQYDRKIGELLVDMENWLMGNSKARNKTVVGTLRTFAKPKQ